MLSTRAWPLAVAASFAACRSGSSLVPAHGADAPAAAPRASVWSLPPVGLPIAPFHFRLLDGTPLTRDSLLGHPTLLALWSDDCPSCPALLAAIDTIQALARARTAVLYLVSLDTVASEASRNLTAVSARVRIALADGWRDVFIDPWVTTQHPHQESRVVVPAIIALSADGSVAFTIPFFDHPRMLESVEVALTMAQRERRH